MILVRRPLQAAIEEFLAAQKKTSFSYREVGLTRGSRPAGYTEDHNRVQLGSGRALFKRAAADLERWAMFNLGWVELFPPNAPCEVDATVAVLVHHFGCYSLNACRIVYLINEERRFGFAYGTLADHAEEGEERFSVEWGADDSVWYDILAFSRPQQWLARIGGPATRLLQKKFARDSLTAMKQASSSKLDSRDVPAYNIRNRS